MGNNKIFILLFMGVFLGSLPLSAKSRRPNQVTETVLRVEVGEKISNFIISSEKDSTVLFFNSSGEKKSRTISMKNYKYIQKLISKTKALKSQSLLQCHRDNVALITPLKTIEACATDTSASGKQLLELANVLSLLF